jgi:hypothetical protein
MTPQIEEQLNGLEVKIEAIQTSVQKTERYLKWTFWLTFFFLVAPLLILLLTLPTLIKSVTSVYGGVL